MIRTAGCAVGICALLAASRAADLPRGGSLLVANKGEHTLGIIDLHSLKQVAAIPEEGVTGHEVAASPDGKRAFVPIYGNSGVGHPGTDGQLIRVIDLEARKIVGTIDFGKGVRPHCAVFGPKDGLLYVTTELEKAVAVIDPQTLKVIGSVPTGQEQSHMLAISHDGRRGYTANVGPGTVSVLDMQARKTVKIIPVSKVVQRIAVSQDDHWVFTADQTQPRLAVIDARRNKLARWVELPDVGYGMAATPDGAWLLVALSRAGKVAVVDARAMKVAHTVDVPKAPQEICIAPDGLTAYASCDGSKKVAVINTRNWAMSGTIEAGKGADGLAWARGE
ncbi:MAG TPA: YncE family protein [Verrucomicrobiae bacterium]|nr:YncE family protein [Verrucomicrobiae bacterium]